MSLNYIETMPEMRTADSPINLVFFNKDGEVGRMFFDEEKKMWEFHGDRDKSVVEFIAWLNVTFKKQFEKKYG